MMLWPAVVALTFLAPPVLAPAPPSTPEAQVLAELNRARADPAAYAGQLRRARGWYRDRLMVEPGAPVAYETQEGVAPVDEAVRYLESLGRSEDRDGALGDAPVLAEAAGDHRAEQGADGTVGHVGADGSVPGERVLRRGGGAFVGEVIAYGAGSPADVVRQLIVDDGVPDRSHRKLLFDPSLRFAGVACGPHPVYRTMCVIDLARTPDGTSRYAGMDRSGAKRLAAYLARTGRGRA